MVLSARGSTLERKLPIYTSAERDRFSPVEMELVEVEARIDNETICRFLLDEEGAVWALSVERATATLDADGVEVGGPLPEAGQQTYPVFLGSPITVRSIRKLNLGEALSEAKKQTGWWRRMDRDAALRAGDVSRAERAQELLDHLRRQSDRRRRRGRYGPRYYAELAEAFVLLCDSGSRAPHKELAGELHISRSTVKNHLTTARELGLLTSRGQGKTGGSLTPRALELLGEGDH